MIQHVLVNGTFYIYMYHLGERTSIAADGLVGSILLIKLSVRLSSCSVGGVCSVGGAS